MPLPLPLYARYADCRTGFSTLQAKLETENTAIEGNFDVAYCLLLHLVFWLIVHDSRDCTPLTVWFMALRSQIWRTCGSYWDIC